MNVLEWGALIVGGGIGAGVRYLLDGAIIRGRKDAFPLGILVVNIVGSFLLGLLAGVPQVSPAWLAIIGFASVVFNFTIVNLFFKGLHAYSGLTPVG